MKKTLFVGFAAAALMAGTSVAAAASGQSQSSQTPSSQTPSSQTPSSPTPSSPMPSSPMHQSGSSSAESSSLSGKIQSIDKENKKVTISSETGGTQDLKLGDKTTIMRDGTSSSFAELKPGDQVRASLDPTTHQATTLEVQSKQEKK